MPASESPTRDVVFIPEGHSNSSGSSSATESNQDCHLSKKPRNYKYWSDEEVKKILNWFTLPENEGKLTRNKAQACREVAKKLFDGDEYMAISVRSKLMSLEKSFREAEQLRRQLSMNAKDEAIINDKIKEINKFHKECKQLFSNRSEKLIPPPPSSTSSNHPPPYISTSPTSHSPPSSQNSTIIQNVPFSPNTPSSSSTASKKHSLLPRYDYDSPTPASSSFSSNNNNNNNNSTSNNSKNSATIYSEPILPHLKENHLRRLSFPPLVSKDSPWSIPRALVDLPPVEDQNDVTPNDHHNRHQHRHSNNQDSPTTPTTASYSPEISSVKIARYAAKQASYSARKAEYEALRSEHEGQKMEYSIRLAEIERERDSLVIKKLKLELEIARSKEAHI